MGKTSVPIRAPLLERAKAIAKLEGMPVQELVDFALRTFTEEYDFEEEESDEESEEESDEELSDEDVESECQDEKT